MGSQFHFGSIQTPHPKIQNLDVVELVSIPLWFNSNGGLLSQKTGKAMISLNSTLVQFKQEYDVPGVVNPWWCLNSTLVQFKPKFENLIELTYQESVSIPLWFNSNLVVCFPRRLGKQ